MENELYHHGVVGMKWGVRRTPIQLGRPSVGRKATNKIGFFKTKQKKAKNNLEESKQELKKEVKKKASELSDDELRAKISRLELEKRYKDLSKDPTSVDYSKKGKDFIIRVLDKSGENIATQAATYALGAALNKAVGKDIVNPKKGQKDK